MEVVLGFSLRCPVMPFKTEKTLSSNEMEQKSSLSDPLDFIKGATKYARSGGQVVKAEDS